jgi:hypothetical protein
MTRLRQREGRATPHAPPSRRAAAGGLLALREAAGNRAFGQLVRAAVARDPAADLKKVGVDDSWLADRLGASELGKTAGKRSIELRFFPGKTARRALVIGGVHGTERQGVQVARLLEKDLAATPSDFSVLLVPVLFPDNAASGPLGIREEKDKPTNRNFPDPGKDLAASGGKDAMGRDILPENQLLMQLMERFKPERIISLHGTQHPEKAGVFYDPRELTAEEARSPAASARPRPSDSEGSSEARYRALYKHKLAAAEAADKDLSLRAAELIDAATTGVKGREARDLGTGARTKKQRDARKQHGSVAGNVGKSGDLDTGHWGGEVPGGTSLGDYASSRGTSIFTVEPPVNRNIADYRKGGDTDKDKVNQADRTTELQAYADAVRTVLLAN